LEVHCHGGAAAIERILDDLVRCGVRHVSAADWQPETRPLAIREALTVLQACTTARTAAVAHDQVRGALVDWAVRGLRCDSDPDSLGPLRDDARVMLAAAAMTTRLPEPLRVVVAGPTNVGKSSLMNAIVGYDRSITMDQAGTTRDVLHADTAVAGIPIRFSDTAGLRDSDDRIEREGIRRARAAVGDADLVLVVTEPGIDFIAPPPGQPALQVLNKVDRLGDPCAADPRQPNDLFRTVAITGQGVPALIEAIAARLAGNLPAPGAPAALNSRQVGILEQLQAVESAGSVRPLMNRLIWG
jgi:tRNA modification GTPase